MCRFTPTMEILVQNRPLGTTGIGTEPEVDGLGPKEWRIRTKLKPRVWVLDKECGQALERTLKNDGNLSSDGVVIGLEQNQHLDGDKTGTELTPGKLWDWDRTNTQAWFGLGQNQHLCKTVRK